jgi:hypothetical protein
VAKPWKPKLHVRYWPCEHLVLLYCTLSPSAYILPLRWTKFHAHIKQAKITVPYHSINSNLSQPTDTQLYSRQRKFDRSLTDQHLSILHFHENMRKIVLWTQHFDKLCGLWQTAVSGVTYFNMYIDRQQMGRQVIMDQMYSKDICPCHNHVHPWMPKQHDVIFWPASCKLHQHITCADNLK